MRGIIFHERMITLIKDLIGVAAVYEQLAEESAELSKAALKCARIVRGENPTPMTLEEALANLKEEYTDTVLVADELGIRPDYAIYAEKLGRWYDRLKEGGYVGQKQESQSAETAKA